MNGKRLLATLFAIGLFFGGAFQVMAVANVDLSEYLRMPDLLVDQSQNLQIKYDDPDTPETDGIVADAANTTGEYEVVALTKEKYDEIKALEVAYEALLADPSATQTDIDNAKAALEAALAAECNNLVATPDYSFTVAKDQLNWIDCEQTTTYTLVFYRLTINSTFYDSYKLQPLTDPAVCEEPATPTTPTTPVATENPKTAIANPYVLGGVSTAITATALMISRKKRYI